MTRVRWMNALLTSLATAALGGCARPLLGPDDDTASDESTSSWDSESTGAYDESSTAPGDEPQDEPQDEPVCHASYSPCLPVVDDLDCPDVVAMGKAPVVVSGSDDYGLDADGDGLGCET